MKVVGIVAEYNPFHYGHKYQIDYARETLGADYIVVAMSGSFTQRGNIACFDKYTRAKMALINGVDLVLEIPAIFSCASAKEYASAAISVLASTGVVDTVLFGAETDDINFFKESANKLIEIEKTEEFNNKIKEYTSSGLTIAQARSKALEGHIDTSIINNPNNILGLEYARFICEKKLPIDIKCIKRQGNEYNDDTLSMTFSSASAIRKALSNNIYIKGFLPDNVFELIVDNTFIDENDISEILHYKLLSEDDFSSYLDSNSDISDRINKLKNEFIDYTSFCDQLKTKNISHSRISRVLCHILLNIKTSDFEEYKNAGYVKSLRMLGFSKNGAALLSLIKTNASLPLSSSPDENTSKTDILASDIVRLIQTKKTGISIPNEYTRKFDLTNI